MYHFHFMIPFCDITNHNFKVFEMLIYLVDVFFFSLDDKRLSDYNIIEFSKLHLAVKKSDNKIPEKSQQSYVQPKYNVDDFWNTLRTVLLKHYDAAKTQMIINQYKIVSTCGLSTAGTKT